MKAIWNGAVIAQSDDTVVVEGNHYFPMDSVNADYLQPSETHTHCAWKGEADYFSLLVDDQTNVDAVWTYREPKEAARQIEGRVAFWKGVQIVKSV